MSSAKLRNSSEFRVVYNSGKRCDGRLMTAFVLPNHCGRHRLGITASRKVSRSAVGRNRMKRLLRESFRLSDDPLIRLEMTYDWVLNAKRSLLKVKLEASLEDFQKIVAQLAKNNPGV